MGKVRNLKPVLSYARLESGKLLIWHDKTVNALLKRAKQYEEKRWVV